MTTTIAIPRNPFSRKPIRRRSLLAGRAQELNQLEYYFKLTADGQSPHVALIGQRGVGKTSLLLSSAELAKDLQLMPVSIDMNARKMSSQGTFWQQFYSALCLKAAELGCWGGDQGEEYNNLSIMIDCQDPIDGSFSLRFPSILARFKGRLDELTCPDAIILKDIQSIQAELSNHKIAGVVVLIDEADYLNEDPATLQMLRNVFQKVDGVSLVLAGTDSLFSSISEIFSPIPRQFHKLDVKQFPHWSATQELVARQLPAAHHHLLPPVTEIIELHELCDGDPAELQLYCFHMYKSIEDGRKQIMTLDPVIFRSVLQEYRSTTPEQAQLVVKRIETLPREFFLNYPWLHCSSLTSTESLALTIFRAEIDELDKLSADERERIERQVHNSYNMLFEQGVSTERDMLKVPGGAIVKAFWKSFVEVDLGERWIWNENPLRRILVKEVFDFFQEKTGAAGNTGIHDFDHVELILKSIVSKKTSDLSEVKIGGDDLPDAEQLEQLYLLQQTLDFFIIVVTAQAQEKTRFLRLPVTVKLGRHSETHMLSFISYDDPIDKEKELQTLQQDRKQFFDRHGLEVSVGPSVEWDVPTDEELEELEASLNFSVRFSVKPRMRRAAKLFLDGQTAEAARLFEDVASKERAPDVLNNLGFCKLILGEHEAARALFQEAINREREPIYFHNMAIALIVQGDTQAGISAFLEALKELAANAEKWKTGSVSMLIINQDRATFYTENDSLVSTAILQSLFNLAAISASDLRSKLSENFSADDAAKWFDHITKGSGAD